MVRISYDIPETKKHLLKKLKKFNKKYLKYYTEKDKNGKKHN